MRVLFLSALVLVLTACGGPSGDGQPLKSSPEQIARGKYLARAADCAACHGTALSGGGALESPFGKLYGSNITPDRDTGIGQWSADDFYKAMHDGTAPGGRQLYPAMPYTSYRGMPREDVDAIYAWLMSRPPIKQQNQDAELSFPYNLRFGVWFWKALFLKDELPAASQGTSPDWLRGRYLANVLGHCGECHTPRGKLGQMNLDESLKGAELGRWMAPDITPAGLAARGWTADDIARFMKTGIAPQGSAFGEMHLVVALSTQHLTDNDLRSLARFTMGDAAPPPVAARPDPTADGKFPAGRQLYLNSCAGCHGRDGDGRPHVAVAMAANSTLRQPDSHNLVTSILDGVAAQDFPGLEKMQEMPGFARDYSDAELADLTNYLRARFAGLPGQMRAEDVAKLRR